MMESAYFNDGNFREYSYFAGIVCSLETGIPGGPGPNKTYWLLKLKLKLPIKSTWEYLNAY